MLLKIVKNEVRISHRVIAENTEIQQKNIIELINKYKNELITFGQLPFETESVKNTVGAINQIKTYTNSFKKLDKIQECKEENQK